VPRAVHLVVVLLLAETGCAPSRLEPREPTPGERTLTVMSFNVHLDRWSDSATVEAIGAGEADVVCLQEVSHAWARVLAARYGHRYPHMLVEPGGSSGLAVLSRFPLEDRGLLEGEEGWHPAWDVHVQGPFGTLQVIQVHLRPVLTGRGDPVSSWAGMDEDHLAQMRAYARAVDRGVPTLVVGDFNEGPRGAAVRWLERSGFGNALHAFRPGQPTWRAPSVGGQLEASVDHILFDADLRPLDAWVLRRGRSDHLPVIARFERARPDHSSAATPPAR